MQLGLLYIFESSDINTESFHSHLFYEHCDFSWSNINPSWPETTGFSAVKFRFLSVLFIYLKTR